MRLPVKFTVYRDGREDVEYADVNLTKEQWRIFCGLIDCQRVSDGKEIVHA